MKKTTALLFAALALVACGRQTSVKGTISEELSSLYGNRIIVADPRSEQPDTLDVVNGAFSFATAPDSTIMIRIAVKSQDGGRTTLASFIPTEGKVSINIGDGDAQVEGGSLNERLKEFNNAQESLYKELSAKLSSIDALPEEAQMAVYDSVNNVYDCFLKESAYANGGNAIGIQILPELLIDCTSSEEVNEIMSNFPESVREISSIASLINGITNLENTKPGSMFVDFEGETMAGDKIRLSDYVGKGNYILVDYWASWCAPCRAEVPTIKQVYEQYNGKGFDVVGIAVWDEKNDTAKAIAELQMPWHIIFDCNKVASDLYGINAIPHIILFAPDGTIVERDLRGGRLIEAVKQALENK